MASRANDQAAIREAKTRMGESGGFPFGCGACGWMIVCTTTKASNPETGREDYRYSGRCAECHAVTEGWLLAEHDADAGRTP